MNRVPSVSEIGAPYLKWIMWFVVSHPSPWNPCYADWYLQWIGLACGYGSNPKNIDVLPSWLLRTCLGIGIGKFHLWCMQDVWLIVENCSPDYRNVCDHCVLLWLAKEFTISNAATAFPASPRSMRSEFVHPFCRRFIRAYTWLPQWAILMSFGASTIIDFMIAASMCFYLQQGRSTAGYS